MNDKSNSLTPSSDFKNGHEIQITMLPTLCLLSWNVVINEGEEYTMEWRDEGLV
jgi:hypothetical protein